MASDGRLQRKGTTARLINEASGPPLRASLGPDTGTDISNFGFESGTAEPRTSANRQVRTLARGQKLDARTVGAALRQPRICCTPPADGKGASGLFRSGSRTRLVQMRRPRPATPSPTASRAAATPTATQGCSIAPV